MARNTFCVETGCSESKSAVKTGTRSCFNTILDLEVAKSHENAFKQHWRVIIAGASETELLEFHFWSRVLDRK